MRLRSAAPFLPLVLLATALPSLHAQQFATAPCPSNGNDSDHDGAWSSWIPGHQDHVCELRHATLPLNGDHIAVDGFNGSIAVVGEDRKDIDLEARVTAQASSQGDAENLLHQVHILTGSDIHAEGPHTSGHASWSVSYRLRVPHRIAARLHTSNGGLAVTAVEGPMDLQTTNGGLGLIDLGGDVHAVTTNGGISVRLAGDRWNGSGLNATTTNGGITVSAPARYSAHLVAETTNGGISVDFPVTVQGHVRNHIDTNLGSGGATLQFQTTNGGVHIGPGVGDAHHDREDREE